MFNDQQEAWSTTMQQQQSGLGLLGNLGIGGIGGYTYNPFSFEAFDPGPPAPKLMTLFEVREKKGSLLDSVVPLEDETVAMMGTLLRRFRNDFVAYDARQSERGDSYIVHTDFGDQLPYLVMRSNGVETKWEECEARGHKIDFIKRFMEALPTWQQGYLGDAKARNQRARDLRDDVEKVWKETKYE